MFPHDRDLSLTTHLDGEIRDGRHHMQVRVYYEDTLGQHYPNTKAPVPQ
jgi:hypothetical protein